MDISLGIIRFPFRRLVERSVKVEEVGEEPSCGDLASELVKVVVAVFGKIAHAPLLLPDLDGEYCGRTIADTLISGVEDLTDYASSFGGGVRSVIDGREDHLVTAT